MDSTLTFAELEFVAGQAPLWPEVRDLLSLPAGADGVAAAGLSSLLARGLATVADGGVQLRDDVSHRVDLLFRPSGVVTLTRGDTSGLAVALALVPDGGGPTALVSLVGPGVFAITPLVAAEDPAVQLRDLVMALAAEGKTALALGPKDSAGEIVLSHDSGLWALGRAVDDPAGRATTTDQASVANTVEKWLRAWLR